MAFLNAETPAPDVAGNGRPEFAKHGVSRISEYANPSSFQPECHWVALGDAANDALADVSRLRVSRLRRRFGLDPTMATLLADLAFSTTGRL